MDNLIYFYNTLSFYLIIILTVVAWMMFQSIFNYSNKTTKTMPFANGRVLEFIWTAVPTLVLVSVAVMSFSLLYMMDDVITPDVTIKVIGHQWYWSYEYFNPVTMQYVEHDSYLVPEGDLSYGFRLLETTPIVLPKNMTVRFLVTAADVLHSWALPSLGIKIDAVPGRLNQVYINTSSGTVAYGQCSELCGVHHGFMPIKAKIRAGLLTLNAALSVRAPEEPLILEEIRAIQSPDDYFENYLKYLNRNINEKQGAWNEPPKE